jgi:WXXGXW repeat (2 copies)
MKKPISLVSILFAILFFLAGSGCGPSSVVVSTQPAPPVYVRPAPAGSNYVWVDGEWIRRGHGYVYRQGYWSAPRRRYHNYVTGHWQQKRQGWYWVPGHWN